MMFKNRNNYLQVCCESRERNWLSRGGHIKVGERFGEPFGIPDFVAAIDEICYRNCRLMPSTGQLK